MSRNKYPAKCYRCGKQVEAGQGHYERASGSRRIALNAPPKTPFWIAQHAGCAIRWRGTNVSIWRASPVQQAAPSGEGE